jgi:predicted nucleic acid-binding protein
VAFPALLDTCVLYPAYLCDTLLRIAEAEAYRPLWSADVLNELRRNVVEAGIPADRVDRRIAHMARSFPDAMVSGYESLIDGMTNDPKDRHVLAAAVRANAEVIVTFNVRDFPEPALKPYDILVVHPRRLPARPTRPLPRPHGRSPRTTGSLLPTRTHHHRRPATPAGTHRSTPVHRRGPPAHPLKHVAHAPPEAAGRDRSSQPRCSYAVTSGPP